MQLFKDKDTKHDNGWIQVQMDHPFYEPGNTASGKIYIRAKDTISGVEGINLEVKGNGKNSFTRHWTEMEEVAEGQYETVEKSEKMKDKKKFMGYKANVHQIDGDVEAGDYLINFSFNIPDDVPSSLMFKNKSKEAPKAKVKYYVKARLICEDKKASMSHKQVLSIREKPLSLETNTKISETSEIKTWMCCSQGTSTLEAEFNKNVFCPNEVAEGDLKINNSNCQVAVSKVTFAIQQVCRQEIKGHHQVETKTIIREEVSGPAAQEADWKKDLDIKLDEIKYEVADFKKKKGKQKKVSDADKFMMASLQPACHTKKFSNEYFLTVTLEYDGMICCVDLPDARMPMSIVPLVNPDCIGAVPSADDFNGTNWGNFHVELSKD